MVVLDVAMPTGFEPVRETVGELVEENANLKRFEIAGRKVILYIEDMLPGETVSFGSRRGPSTRSGRKRSFLRCIPTTGRSIAARPLEAR